jgi:hypothetical protein
VGRLGSSVVAAVIVRKPASWSGLSWASISVAWAAAVWITDQSKAYGHLQGLGRGRSRTQGLVDPLRRRGLAEAVREVVTEVAPVAAQISCGSAIAFSRRPKSVRRRREEDRLVKHWYHTDTRRRPCEGPRTTASAGSTARLRRDCSSTYGRSRTLSAGDQRIWKQCRPLDG